MAEATVSQIRQSPREPLATRRMIRVLLIIEMIGVAGLAIADALTYPILRTAYVAAPLFVVLAACLWLVQREILLPAQILIPIGPLLVRDYLAFEGVGVHDVSLIAFPIVIILAYLTLDKIRALVVSGLTILSTSIIALTASAPLTANVDDAISIAILLAAVTAVIHIIVSRLNENVERAYRNEQAQIKANKALEEERANLEIRVKERTQALERRAVQLRTAAEIGNAAASIRDLDTLLNQIARSLSSRFGFYHTGIFLIDEVGQYAVLRAANSEGGQRMLRRGHKLEIGRKGIVGYVADTGRARIALDVGKDAVYFNNPDLPNTHSEMALPLKAAGHVVGVLDIQSTESQAFTEEDVQILQVIADQIAIAIENSRLLAESQTAVEAARRAYGETAIASWKRLLEKEQNLGFVGTERGVLPLVLAKEYMRPEAAEAMSQNQVVTSADQSQLFAPISIRGQVIGVLRLAKPNQTRWTENETQIVRGLADQLSGALESARLYNDAQRRAAKEHTIEEISARVGASPNIDSIMQSAVQELGKIMADSEITIQLEPSRITAEQ
jgi:GAF domain-containing protein